MHVPNTVFGKKVHSAAGRGFTLIELLIVLVVASILAAIAVPSYTAYTRRAARAEAKSAMLDMAQRQERFYTNNGTYAAVAVNAENTTWVNFSGSGWANRRYEITATAGNIGSAGTISATGDLTSGIVISAIPANGWNDPECGTLSLDSTGARSSSNNARCW